MHSAPAYVRVLVDGHHDGKGRNACAQTWSESAMQQWGERTGGVYRKTRLRKADVEELRHLRAGIADALRRRDGMEHQAPKTSATLARVGISAVIGADAGVALELSRQGWENLASAMA